MLAAALRESVGSGLLSGLGGGMVAAVSDIDVPESVRAVFEEASEIMFVRGWTNSGEYVTTDGRVCLVGAMQAAFAERTPSDLRQLADEVVCGVFDAAGGNGFLIPMVWNDCCAGPGDARDVLAALGNGDTAKAVSVIGAVAAACANRDHLGDF